MMEGATMVTRESIDSVVRILAEAARQARTALFGSDARGDARDDSDIGLLVIDPRVEDRAREMVRLRRLLRPIPPKAPDRFAHWRAAGCCAPVLAFRF